MAEVRIKDIDEHEIDTILAEDIDFEGYLTFKKPLMIKGKFKGEIKSTSSLYIGEKALVEATTEAAVVSSKGAHKGDIIGHSRVELFSTAQVDGDISTPDFIVESGCKFNGYCNMGVPRKTAPQPAPQPAAAPQSAPRPAPQAAPQPAPQSAVPHASPQQQGAPAAQQSQQHNQQPGQQSQQQQGAPAAQQSQQRPGAPSSGSGGQQK
ncbi:MAG: polymer-forming cytoskeletal protein [Spirochaetia bacterium]